MDDSDNSMQNRYPIGIIGIIVSGDIDEGAQLVAVEYCEHGECCEHDEYCVHGKCSEHDDCSEHEECTKHEECSVCKYLMSLEAPMLLGRTNFRIVGTYRGMLTVEIPVDKSLEGEIITVAYCEDGKLKILHLKVKDGFVTFETEELHNYFLLNGKYEVDENGELVLTEESDRELSDAHRDPLDVVLGILVSGDISAEAYLKTEEHSRHENCPECQYLARLEDAQLLGCFNFLVEGNYLGAVTVRIPVNSEFDGKTLSVAYCQNGALKVKHLDVTEGYVTFETKELHSYYLLDGIYHVNESEELVKSE